MTPPRIAIVGAGAIGCRIAAHLAQQGQATTLFDGWRAHVDAVNASGLVLQRPDGREERFAATAHPLDAPGVLGAFDVVLLAVRSDATEALLPLVQRLLAPEACVVSCQNGVNEEAIAAAVGAAHTLGCSMVFGARLVAPGVVRVLPGPDQLRTGEYLGGPSARLDRIVGLFAACGTSTATHNLMGYRWMKLVLNATGNPLLLLTGLDAQGLHARADARRVIIGLAREILGTAVAQGIAPEPVLGVPVDAWCGAGAPESPVLHVALRAHGESLGTRRLSMVADFEARGRTEVDHITGHAVRKAQALGRPVPLNEAVWRMVKQMESGERQAGEQALAALLEVGA
jgi:2-dehydropantoate 2-reductase